MSSMIRIQPAARLRREFAAWATAQTPKIRTTAPNTFAVPAHLFVEAPDAILIGALVDGRRYISPEEDRAHGVERPAPDWTPPVLPEQEAVPGEALPPLPDEAYGPDSVPLPPPDFAPLEDAPVVEDQDDSDPSDSGPHTCEACGRPFGTAHGLTVHRRMMHTEES